MSDEVTEPGVGTAQNDQTEMADLMAGYNARSGNTLPAEVPQTQSAQPESIPANAAPTQTQEGSTAPEQKDAAQLLEERLATFKEEVRAMASNGDPAAVRKLHGEIGDINRKLKQMEPRPAPQRAPVDEELTAAMLGAEKVAEDFQELGGPLVTALKAVAKAGNRPQEQQGLTQEQISAQIESRAMALLEGEQQRQLNEAVTALKAEHPDFATVKDSPEFSAWVKAKPSDLQSVIFHTENPVLASRYLSEFKDSQRTQQKKQGRLASAVTPTGVPAPTAAPSKLTPEEEVMLGYNKTASRSSFRQFNKR